MKYEYSTSVGRRGQKFGGEDYGLHWAAECLTGAGA